MNPTTQPLYRVTAHGRHGTVTMTVTQLPSDRAAAYGPRYDIERIATEWPCKSCTTECYCAAGHDADTDCVYCEINAEAC
jgi:hypothetical protein